MAAIADIFRRNNIDFRYADISRIAFLMSLPETVKEYLQCMGKTIKRHQTEYGSAWTTLYNIKDLVDNQYPVCNENNLLIIGFGMNGDLLTVNLKNNCAGYVFHDSLSEENYSDIEDIYCEMPYDIKTFLEMVFETETYPIDGTMAEEMQSS